MLMKFNDYSSSYHHKEQNMEAHEVVPELGDTGIFPFT